MARWDPECSATASRKIETLASLESATTKHEKPAAAKLRRHQFVPGVVPGNRELALVVFLVLATILTIVALILAALFLQFPWVVWLVPLRHLITMVREFLCPVGRYDAAKGSMRRHAYTHWLPGAHQ